MEFFHLGEKKPTKTQKARFESYKNFLYSVTKEVKKMLNQIILVGRLVKDPEIRKAKNGTSYSYITIAVPRSYKNVNGEYETDFIGCTLWKMMATNTKEYCKKGDILGVKGRIESKVYEKDDETKYKLEVIAERITFLSSNNHESKSE